MSLDQFLELRNRFDRFVYESCQIRREQGTVHCVFAYRLQGVDRLVSLEHQVRFALLPEEEAFEPDALFARSIFLLGLAEAVSYWKTACPYLLEVEAGPLAPQELAFWERLYTRGLGEFWYLNGIYGHVPEDAYIRLVPSQTQPDPVYRAGPLSGALIPVGGGKDSVVSLELLRRLGHDKADSDCFLLSARQAAYDTAELAGYGADRRVEAFRIFDPQLFAMNREGYLNGHVPYSAILGFTAVSAALLRGRKYIVLSNEGSANEPTVPGTWVNHQYSKSLEFETDFQQYLHRFLTPSVHYFSLLRPWSEARIAMEFSGFPLYHAAYRSCNRGVRENRWCCNCPKCLFVFLLVAAHAGVPATAAMLGENLLEKESLIPTLDELAGFSPVKPFECVGTVAETIWSLHRILERTDLPAEAANWPLLRHFVQQSVLDESPAFRLVEPELGDRIPYPFRSLVLPGEPDATTRIRARLDGKSIGILGFGLEGRSSLAFLRRLYPEKIFPVADREPDRLADVPEGSPVFSGPEYASALVSCDLVFKAPGIPWMSIDSLFRPEQITSQTDLFLSVLGERTIGVTGTKGKSTTTALIHAALRACGQDAAMVGNMGIPALEAIGTDHPGRVYVCELSSHMLETIHHAPRCAVYLNLYADHLDHYRSIDAYAAAKDNLLRLQGPEGFAVVGETVVGRTEKLGGGLHVSVRMEADGSQVLPVHSAILNADAFADRDRSAHCAILNADAFADRDRSVHSAILNADAFADRDRSAHCAILNADAFADRDRSVHSAILNADAFADRDLPGSHNLMNLHTAFLTVHLWEMLVAGHAEGLADPAPQAAALHALNTFSGLPHRMRLVGTMKGIRFWDDSISTIPEASMLAVEAIGDVDTLVFGGLDRGIRYDSLIRYLAQGKVPVLIGLPDTGHRLLDALAAFPELPSGIRLIRAANMEEAVSSAYRWTRPGHSCLLSPAAASYGWYRNFEERGDHFTRLVLAESVETVIPQSF